ncbi:T9SS type B sorting domain-containing protein [Galbibacter sp. EGI 63066]|uniref:T9SS type B sorting domain-containing protein n=1 Tax=Galbibacter sp. EGI 63066 TaxID=2993559 RepID=UPI00224989B0|nr:T9SS type B sorting domain-containing protein [Galbibacter sp. EGI 63066]MCX2679224.1 T9SS type B sorting domain-containing protein [Galbibacter sp. EGI 63066]
MLKTQNALLFILLVFLSKTNFGQENSLPNDCVNAIVLCGNGKLSSNAQGFGTQELFPGSNSCFSDENNSLWLKIDIVKSGTLGFTLKPSSTDIMVDYDFFIFGPNASCNDLGQAIRCSTTNPDAAGLTSNHTGMNDTATETSEGPGPDGDSFVKSLDVSVGDSYYIVIDRPHGDGGFELEWTGTATQGGMPFPTGVEANNIPDQHKSTTTGSYTFLLNDFKREISTDPNVDIRFFENETDAIDNANPLPETISLIAESKTIYARVTSPNGCFEIINFKLSVAFEFDKFFTPNGDGINDFWPIENVSSFLLNNSYISIFDRYGKLVKQLRATSLGWDGTINGNPLPEADYWFHATLKDGKEVKGHFALKR